MKQLFLVSFDSTFNLFVFGFQIIHDYLFDFVVGFDWLNKKEINHQTEKTFHDVSYDDHYEIVFKSIVANWK